MLKGAGTSIEETTAFCVPAANIFCQDCSWQSGTCYNGECEGLHLSSQDQNLHGTWDAPESQKLIITAGPERSGSTWLFNAIRLLLKSARIAYDPYWITNLSQSKLEHRKHFAQGRFVVIKTHYWSDDWDPSQADHIFLTHRELSEVVASYRRVGWAFNIPDSYVREHQQWQAVTEQDIAYEDIMQEPVQQLQLLAQSLGIADKVDVQQVNQELQSLKPARKGAPDPVSKLWPNHYSATVQRKHESGVEPLDVQQPAQHTEVRSQLKWRFPNYYRQYGYD